MSDEPLFDIRIGAIAQDSGGRRFGVQAASHLLRARRRVILVHGFNTSPEASAKDYDRFRDHLRGLAPRLNRDVKTLTWPGRALYWNAVIRSRGDSAQVLSGYLARAAARRPEELVFVAHSLGCRLVLEALDRMPAADRASLLPRVRLFLMAAAVPTRLVAAGGALRSAVADCARAEIFYSRSDLVLGTVFTFGQLGDMGRFTEAVGWSGEPASLWGRGRHHMVGYGHGAYWTNEATAYRVASSLGAAQERRLAGQPAKSRAMATRDDLTSRPLGSRRLSRRAAS